MCNNTVQYRDDDMTCDKKDSQFNFLNKNIFIKGYILATVACLSALIDTQLA